MTPLPERVRLWTLAALVSMLAADLAVIRSYADRSDLLSPGWARLAWAAVYGTVGLSVLLLLLMVVFWRRLDEQRMSIAVLVFFLLLGLAPGLAKGVGRLQRGPTFMIFDTLLHVEVAARLLSEGRNPYREDYAATEMGRWHEGRDRVQLHHLVYPPLSVVVTAPLQAASIRLFGAYDSRLIWLPALGATFALCWRRWAGNPWRPLLLALAFLNPLLFGHHHGGKVDTLALVFLILGLCEASRGRPLGLAVMLGLAAATKTNFVLAAPFGLAWAASTRRDVLRWSAAWGAAFAVWFLPFLVWDAGALIEDLLIAPGRGTASDPLLVDAGAFGGAWPALLAGNSPAFPFWALQIPATLAVAWTGVRDVLRERTLFAFGLAAATTVGVFFYFNRFSDAAYFGTLLAWVAAAAGFSARRAEAAPS